MKETSASLLYLAYPNVALMTVAFFLLPVPQSLWAWLLFLIVVQS